MGNIQMVKIEDQEKAEKKQLLIRINKKISPKIMEQLNKTTVNKALYELTLEQKKPPQFSKEIAEHIINQKLDKVIKSLDMKESCAEFKKEELVFPTTRRKIRTKVRRFLGKLKEEGVVESYDWCKKRRFHERPRRAENVYAHTGKKFRENTIKI